jgi:putative oxidoreductase
MPSAAINQSVSTYREIALLVGRILIGALFLIVAYNSAMNIAGTTGYLASLGIPAPGVAIYLKLAIEFLGGLAILIGWHTRLAALVLVVFVLVAALFAHMKFGDGNQLNHFLKNMAIIGGLLAIYVTGSGAHSVDGKS